MTKIGADVVKNGKWADGSRYKSSWWILRGAWDLNETWAGGCKIRHWLTSPYLCLQLFHSLLELGEQMAGSPLEVLSGRAEQVWRQVCELSEQVLQEGHSKKAIFYDNLAQVCDRTFSE